jgi:hypothetical protein
VVYLSTGFYFKPLHKVTNNLGKPVTGTSPSSTDRVYLGDFDADGRTDILSTASKLGHENHFATPWDGFRLYFSTGDGFAAPISSSAGGWAETFTLADFNGIA